MAHPNTHAAYDRIVDEGLLSKAQIAVCRALLEMPGEPTRNEIDRYLGNGRPNPAYSRRLKELEDRGVIERVGSRPCKVTGFAADTWQLTGRLPLPKRRQAVRPTANDVRKAIAWLRAVEVFVGPIPPELEKIIAWLEYRFFERV